MPDNRLDIHYHVNDVTSVQRMRMLRSSQFKLIIGFWGLGVVFMALHILLPSVFQFIQGVTWLLVGEMTLVYFVTVASLLYIAPWISFQFTRFWRLPLVFQYNSKSLRLSLSTKKTGGLRLKWGDVRRFEETKRSFVIYYEDNDKHIIIPKSAFTERSEARFRDIAARGMAAAIASAVASESARSARAEENTPASEPAQTASTPDQAEDEAEVEEVDDEPQEDEKS